MTGKFVTLWMLLASAVVLANDYTAEVGVAIGQGETGMSDIDTTTLALQVYLDEVDTSQGPLREASFLSKASGFLLGYSEIDSGYLYPDEQTSISGRYVTSSDWIVFGDYTKLDSSAGNIHTVTVGGGKYLSANSELIVSFGEATHTETMSVDYHNLIREKGISVDLGLDYIDSNLGKGSRFNFGGAWYPNNNFGLGAHISMSSGDLDYGITTIEAEYFVVNNLSLTAIYGTGEEYGFDTDFFLAGLSYRF